MKKIKYTRITLEKFSLKELQKICKYYDIEFLPSWSKAKLTKEILNYSPLELIEKTYNYDNYNYNNRDYLREPIKTETKKSVRIQRIEDRKE